MRRQKRDWCVSGRTWAKISFGDEVCKTRVVDEITKREGREGKEDSMKIELLENIFVHFRALQTEVLSGEQVSETSCVYHRV